MGLSIFSSRKLQLKLDLFYQLLGLRLYVNFFGIYCSRTVNEFFKKIISSICSLLISHAFRLLEQMLLKTGKKSFVGLYEQLALLVEGIFVGKQ